MKVFITYDRYEHDEWYSVYHIDTDEQSAIEHFIEKDLPSFLSYGPDDCHSFVLQEVNMTKKKFELLCKLNETSNKENELKEMLMEIYDSGEGVLYFTDGCSDIQEIIRLYCEDNFIDPEDCDTYNNACEMLFNNEECWNEYMNKYIENTY